MNKKEIVAEEVYQTVREAGLAKTLYGIFGSRVKISVPFAKVDCDESIDKMDLSVRAFNALKRAGAFTVGDVIDLISNDELMKIRNLGRKTAVEIKVGVMEFGYSRLTEREKKAFLSDVIKRNC